MELAKSRKLRADEAADDAKVDVPLSIPTQQRDDIIRIRPIETLNEFVIVMPFTLETNILLPSNAEYQPYGIVVGSSLTIMAPDGSRVASVLRPGDVVRFWERNIVDQDYKTPDPLYANRRLILLSERGILTRLPPVPFELITAPAPLTGNSRQLAVPVQEEDA